VLNSNDANVWLNVSRVVFRDDTSHDHISIFILGSTCNYFEHVQLGTIPYTLFPWARNFTLIA